MAPVPKWHFLLKNYSVWMAFVISVLLGSLSFSVVVHRMVYGDWEVVNIAELNPLLFFFTLLPYFWLIFLGLLSVLAYVEWKHTKHGYRFKTYYVIVGSILASAFLGSIFYKLGLGKRIDMAMIRIMPYYHDALQKQRSDIWLRPDKGLLTGEVQSVDEAGTMTIRDGSGREWTVIEDAATITQLQNRQQNSVPAVGMQIGSDVPKKKRAVEVVVIAERGKQGEFIAKKIRVIDDEDDDEDEEEDEKTSQVRY